VRRHLLISDLQIPFHEPFALPFLVALQDEFQIPHENVYCVGDEIDHYYISRYLNNPNQHYSAMTELQATREILKDFYSAFPLMKLCTSNHGTRPMKAALEAGLPSEYLKEYRDVIKAPRGWKWKEIWHVKTKHHFKVEHGDAYSGLTAHRNAAISNMCSTAIGHIHSHAGVSFVHSRGGQVWGMNVGCLIDNDTLAFEYNKKQKFKPTLGCGVVIDDGRFPIFIPY